MQRHVLGVVKSVMIVLSQIFQRVCQWRNYENPLPNDWVIDMSWCTTFFWNTVYMIAHMGWIGLGWIKKIGPMSNTVSAWRRHICGRPPRCYTALRHFNSKPNPVTLWVETRYAIYSSFVERLRRFWFFCAFSFTSWEPVRDGIGRTVGRTVVARVAAYHSGHTIVELATKITTS